MENRKTVPPKDFRGLLWAPSYEQEVVLLFGLLLPYLNEPISIDECRESFPDCIAIRSRLGSTIRIEFELKSSHFQQHGHDPAGCDMIVCWWHDWTSCPKHIEIIELPRVIKDHGLEFVLEPVQSKYPSVVWNEESFFKAAGPNPPGYIRDLYHFCCSQPGLTVLFGSGAKQASFTVRSTSAGAPRSALLGVSANGKIWPYFVDLPKPIGDQFRSNLARIDRIRASAETKDWFDFVLSDEKELEILVGALRWLATLKWRSD